MASDDPMRRAMQRITDGSPAQLLRQPISKKTVKGKPRQRGSRARRSDPYHPAAPVSRKFDPTEPRDPHSGKWIDTTPSDGGSSKLRDALKLAGKIDLAPDEQLIGSAKLDGDAGGVRMAIIEQAGRRTLRFGAGGEGYGQRNRDEGVAAWDGNPSRGPLSKADQERLNAEQGHLDAEYDSATPARQEEITKRLQDIREQINAGKAGFNGTAKLDDYSTRRLVDRIRPALDEAVDEAKAEAAAWDEIDALEAKGNPDPARMAELRRIARADSTDTLIFIKGVVPGAEWGDVHFSVELDETDPYLTLGVQPKGAPDDWGEDKDWQGRFDIAETRKILRLIDKFSRPT